MPSDSASDRRSAGGSIPASLGVSDPSAQRHLPIALIGDIVGSRGLDDRAGVQARLRAELAALAADREVESASLAPLALTAGDELQGIFNDPAAVVRVVVTLAEALFPVRIVYGLGRGELATAPGPEVALLDGPCFHRARKALEVASKGDVWLVASGFGDTGDSTLAALFGLQGALRAKWTARQAEIAGAVRRALALGRTRRDVAGDLGISPSVVTESLQAAAFDPLRRGERAAVQVLEKFGMKAESEQNSANKTNRPTPKERP